MLCILYVNAVGALLGMVGLSIERMLPSGAPRRWVWCLIVPLSIFVPGLSHQPHRRRRHGTAKAPVVDGVPIVITERLGPATVGLMRSSVLVPRWVLALPGVQRRYVLRHEEEHRRARDAHLLLFASLPLLLMPWNLAMWWQLRRLSLAVELDCDNRVVNALGDAAAYSELLLTVAQAASRTPRLQPAFLGGAGSLERRLRALLSPTPVRGAQKFLLPVLTVGLLFIVVWMPHPILGRDCASSQPGPSVANASK